MITFTLVSNEAAYKANKLIQEAQSLQSINPNFKTYVSDMEVIEEILRQTKEMEIDIQFIRQVSWKTVEYNRQEMEAAVKHNMQVLPLEE